jgi:N-acetyl-gamma-glutamylphosphate reductase
LTHTIFIDGEAGTTGLEIRERLEARSDLELILLGDRRREVEARREALDPSPDGRRWRGGAPSDEGRLIQSA